MNGDEAAVVEIGHGTLMEQLRRKRAEAASHTTVDLAVPGYKGDIVARYQLIDVLVEGKEIQERLQRQFEKDDDRMHFGMIDTLIAACTGLYFRNDEGQLEPIDPDGQGPAQYDHRLAAAFGYEAESARDALVKLFNGNNLAIRAHALRLSEWMADPSRPPLGEA